MSDKFEITEKNLFDLQLQLKAIQSQRDDLKAQLEITKNAISKFDEAENELKLALIQAMQEAGQSKAEFTFIKATISKPSKIVSITDAESIPKEFIKKKETESIDKAGIKKLLQKGEVIPGAELTDGAVTLKIEDIEPEI